MKKNYIGIVALAICSTGFAQNGVVNTTQFTQKANLGTFAESTTPLREKATLIWSDDFSTPANWVLSNASTPALDWHIDMNGDASIPANSNAPTGFTTLNNGYLLIDSDGIAGNSDGNGTPTVVSAINATPIDLSAEPYVTLVFEHNYRYWQDSRAVRVSGDNGANWTTFDITTTVFPASQNSGNPEVTSIEISAVAGGQSQVLIDFVYNDNDFWGWYWAVDDVAIYTTEQHDLVASTPYFGSLGYPYFSIPTTQIAPIDFYAVATNAGYADQTGSMVSIDVNGGTFTGTSAGMTLVAQTFDTLIATTQYTPAAAAGNHAITYAITSDNTDATPGDNGLSDAFDVVASDGQYGRDRGTYDGQGGGEDGATPGDFAFEAGNVMDIFADQTLYQLDVVIGTDTPPGTIIYGKLYEWDGAAFVYVDETAEYTTTQADADNNVTINLELFTQPTVTAGTTYLPVVGCYSEFYYGTSGESEDQTSYVMYPTVGGAGSQYYTNGTPMVRMNFSPVDGVSENVSGNMELGQNIPNPFNNTTAINYSVKSNVNVTLTVVDMTGKVVMTVNEGTKAAGDYKITLDASTLAGGMYHYTLSNGTTSITKSMSVVK